MKDEIIYRKQGRRYVPIGICDNAASYWPKGAHLVIVEPGSRYTLYHVEPAMAALEAAARKMQDGMVQAMQKAAAAGLSACPTPELSRARMGVGWNELLARCGQRGKA